MKKLIALLLALALCIALCACGQDKPETPAAQTDAPGAAIPKPAETKPTDPPKEMPATQPTETPEPTPEPTKEPLPAIEVRDLCAVAGSYIETGGYSVNFSYTLPEVSGPDTPYIRELNDTMQKICDEYVADALDALNESLSLPRYCISYYYGSKDGIHSLLVTSDSDWGMDEYWCFNFDDAGNEVDNSSVLKAAGLTPETFVSAAYDYFEAETDLSEYFEDDGWKEYRDNTLAEENCNAELPMVILPNGNLCFIGTIYTPAGAGQYDDALEFVGKQEIRNANVGRSLMSRLSGTYLLKDEDNGEYGTFCEFYTVGDTLMMEITSFEPEYGDVFSYYAAEIVPDDPAALLRADGEPVRVRVLTYCPDVFGGSYYGEPGYYKLSAADNRVCFSDFEGGTPLFGGGEDVYLSYAYRDDLNLSDPVPETDYDHFDYDLTEASGLAGVWSGTYYDEDFETHCLTMELTNWGKMILRDSSDSAAIPRVLAGSYYIAQEGDDMAPAGAVVYNLVAVGGYKMPVMGSVYLELDEDGTLLVDVDPDSWSKLIDLHPDYYGGLRRVPKLRFVTDSAILQPAERESVYLDIAADGQPEEISYYFTRDESEGDVLSALTIVLEGEEHTLYDLSAYAADVYLMVPGMSGAVYFYVDGLSDNDYHFIDIIAVEPDDVWYVGGWYRGGGVEQTESVDELRLGVRSQLLSTASASRAYRVGSSGMPEAIEPYFHFANGIELTSKRDLDCWIVAPDSGELVDTTTLPAGTKAVMYRTDCVSFVDLLLDSGDCRRVWVDGSEWPQTIDGIDIGECFDGISFAG